MINRLISFSLLFIFFSANAAKQRDDNKWQTFLINSEHSEIRFEVPYMGITKVSGHFEEFKGSFERHRHTGKVKDINVQVKAASIDTSDKKRDKHLKSEDFFNVKNFPRIYLQKGEIFHTDDNAFNLLKGQLTLRGETRPFVLKTQSLGEKKDQMGKKIIFFKARGEVNRKDFGMNWNQVLDNGGFVIGDIIKLRIRVEASPSDEKPAFSRFMIPQNNEKAKPRRKHSKSLPSEDLKNLNEKVNQLTSDIVKKERELENVKKQNKKLEQKIASLKEKPGQKHNFINSALLTFLFLISLGSITWITKSKLNSLFVIIPESLLKSQKNKTYSFKWLLEWLGDYLFIFTLVVVLLLTAMYF